MSLQQLRLCPRPCEEGGGIYLHDGRTLKSVNAGLHFGERRLYGVRLTPSQTGVPNISNVFN